MSKNNQKTITYTVTLSPDSLGPEFDASNDTARTIAAEAYRKAAARVLRKRYGWMKIVVSVEVPRHSVQSASTLEIDGKDVPDDVRQYVADKTWDLMLAETWQMAERKFARKS